MSPHKDVDPAENERWDRDKRAEADDDEGRADDEGQWAMSEQLVFRQKDDDPAENKRWERDKRAEADEGQANDDPDENERGERDKSDNDGTV